MTIRDMLSHTVGLRAYADLSAEPAVLTREEYVRTVISARPEYPFRSRFQYSNGMITAVGLIVGAIKGATWEEAVAQEVLRPLGMHQALASFEDLPSRPDHAIGYVYDPVDAGWRSTPPPRSLVAMAPAGAICASANELALWLKALTHDGAPLVGAKTFNEITEPQIAISASMAYALSWGVYGWNGMKVVEHNGGSRGICALVSFIPQTRTGFVFLGNTSPNFLTRIGSLGPLIYPLLLNVAGPTDVPVTSAQPLIPLPPKVAADDRVPPPLPALSLEEVLERVRSAPGDLGSDSHRTLSASGVKSYESQGITASVMLHAAVPASREESEVWRAADREIGRLRIYFDGEAGGQETTFGQDAVNDATTNMAMRRDFDFRPWRNLLALYPEVAVAGGAWIDDRAVLRLNLGDDEGHLSVGLDDWLVVEREKGGVRTLYSDYRRVDGELVAYRTETHDGLGLTSLQWYEVVFDVEVPSAAFEAAVSAS
ncbi:beta-lactamase/D-alanine carboxypeptidase [compost metagenome]